MAVMTSAGTERARSLLNGVPDRFNEFCHMDQITFVQLADWIVEHAESNTAPDISVEESLFVFLDIVAQGNSFRSTAYGWDHDIKLTQRCVFSPPLLHLNRPWLTEVTQHLPQRTERAANSPGKGRDLPFVPLIQYDKVPMADPEVLAGGKN